MKKILQAIILTSISFSFFGCAYHTTRSYAYGSQPVYVNRQPVFVTESPFYRSVKPIPDYPPYRKDTPHIYVIE